MMAIETPSQRSAFQKPDLDHPPSEARESLKGFTRKPQDVMTPEIALQDQSPADVTVQMTTEGQHRLLDEDGSISCLVHRKQVQAFCATELHMLCIDCLI